MTDDLQSREDISDDDRFLLDGITLRLVTPDDCTPAYLGWLRDPDVNRFLETRWHEQSLASVTGFVAGQRAASNSHLFAILDEAQRHVGNIKIGPIEPNQQYGDVSYLIGDRSSWGQGIGHRAVALAVEIGFRTLGLHRLQAGVHAANIGSTKVLERAGFQYEGTYRQQALVDGQRQDVRRYGLLCNDPRPTLDPPPRRIAVARDAGTEQA